MEIVIKTIKDKRYNRFLFRVICGNKNTSNLEYSEMLGLVSALTMPKERPTQLLLTEQEMQEVNKLINK
jgi:hypothetical protein